MSEKLKPCPFCGEPAIVSWSTASGRGGWWVWCKHCDAETPMFATMDEAIGAWNGRLDVTKGMLRFVNREDKISEKLKPCPFCGGSKFHIKEFDGVLEDCTVFHVRCMDCGAEMEGEGVNPDPDIRREWALKDAVERWNRRVCDVKRT